jgi:GR25 family glycosyltransferase involved in LPS biosynthesis
MKRYEEDANHVKKKYIFKKSLFNDSIDATYILYLEGNRERYNSIIKQIHKYPLTNIVYIIHNPGYKKCKKNVLVKNSASDCKFSHYEAYIHAENNNYKNIIILEDDFILSKNIDDDNKIKNINRFLKKNIDTNFIFLFGCIPVITIPCVTNFEFYKLYKFGATHTYVVSHKFRQKILSFDKQNFITSPKYFENSLIEICDNAYMYYKPLSYQIFEETENRITYWDDMFMNFFIRLLNLDKIYEPGYSIIYFTSKYLLIIIFIFIIIIMFYIYFL